MNQTAEDTTTDEEIALSVVEKPKSEFVRPTYRFKGNELFPFTYGYELLFNQVRDAEDTGLFTWLAFVYLLRKHEPDEKEESHRKWAIKICWRVEDFRGALMSWMDLHGPFTTEDKIEAKRIYEENMKAIADSVVEPVPVRGNATQKKNLPPEEAAIIYVLRRKLGCTRDEILWNMTVVERNLMLHAFYFMEGREVRKPEERSKLLTKFQRVLNLFGKR